MLDKQADKALPLVGAGKRERESGESRRHIDFESLSCRLGTN